MIAFYPNWIFLDKTEDGEYLYESPSSVRNYRTEKTEEFLTLEKIYKEYIGEEYPTAKIVEINYENDRDRYRYIIKVPYTHKELRGLLLKHFKILATYKNDKRITEGALIDLLPMLQLFKKIYLNEKE
jgi:hypothetical protein|nr:MAG TPA: hypothetical protein [Caudoviricetes sp.]